MGILRTKVYKECYPFSREVLYDVEKKGIGCSPVTES